jgi:hypothetical protein
MSDFVSGCIPEGPDADPARFHATGSSQSDKRQGLDGSPSDPIAAGSTPGCSWQENTQPGEGKFGLVPADASALDADRNQYLLELAAAGARRPGVAMARRLLPDPDDRLAAGLALLVGALALIVLVLISSQQT